MFVNRRNPADTKATWIFLILSILFTAILTGCDMGIPTQEEYLSKFSDQQCLNQCTEPFRWCPDLECYQICVATKVLKK